MIQLLHFSLCSDFSDWHYNVAHFQLCILVAGALGGRFDHEIGNINVLCRFSTTRIILLSDDCLIHLLPRTHHHEIHVHSSVEGPHCGLIPIGMPSASTTTTGLQWDLSKYCQYLNARLFPSHLMDLMLFLLSMNGWLCHVLSYFEMQIS